MRFQALALLAAPLLAAPLFAQSPAVAVAALPSQNCPVDLEAQHASQGGLVETRRGDKRKDLAYRLTFLPGDAQAIVEAKVRLHGIAGPTVIPANTAGDGTATERLTLAPTRASSHHYASVVYPEKLTGVQWIEIESLRFADGSDWKASRTSVCRVAPNGFLLVAAGK